MQKKGPHTHTHPATEGDTKSEHKARAGRPKSQTSEGEELRVPKTAKGRLQVDTKLAPDLG